MNRILVTGVNGFVGHQLCQYLMDKEFEVYGSIRQTSRSDNLKIHKNFTVGDINSDTDWSSALQGCQYVVHLAARVHVMKEVARDPLSDFRKINTEGTLNLARQAAEQGVKRFIYLSSIKVNGEVTHHKNSFSADDIHIPTDPYALSKYEAEQGLLKLAEETSMEVVIIRPPLVYGPNVKANFLTMMKWLYKRIPLPFGAIHNNRSLVALDNLIDLIFTCISHPAAANQVFLVSDGEDLSTTELLTRVAIALGKKPRLFSINQQLLELVSKLFGKYDIAQRLCSSLQVDISKTKNLLNWTPPVSVDEGLHKTAQHFLRRNLYE